ncbi:hypothetical protein GCM10028805_15510 [Spirosoma harenae]
MSEVVPVVVFAYNRVDLLRQLLICLKNENVPLLYIFSDGPKNHIDESNVEKVRSELNKIDWCDKVIYQQDINIGLGKSILYGVNKVLTLHKSAIFFEDDLICTKGTYKYLTSALNTYEHDQRVMSVTGWTHPSVTPKNLNNTPYFDGKAECWCWGTWARAWKGMERTALELYNECILNGIDVEKYGSDLPKMALEAEEKNLWAIRWWFLHLLQDGLCFRPPYSLIETTGWDGRGTTITPDMKNWANPPLKECPPIPSFYPTPSENADCSHLWKLAIDKSQYNYTNLPKPELQCITSDVWVIDNLLTNTECGYLLIKALENRFNDAKDMHKYGRYNQETFFKHEGLLNLIRSRLVSIVNRTTVAKFSAEYTTELFEFYLYKQEGFAKIHSDAPIEVGKNIYSNHTLLIYLNDDFEDGETYFKEANLRIKPKKGGALLFDQSLDHSGLKVTKGEKYVLRFCLLVDDLEIESKN